jgi:hypothetical protein
VECAYGVVGKILMGRILIGIYLVRFGFRVWEMFDFKVIFCN